MLKLLQTFFILLSLCYRDHFFGLHETLLNGYNKSRESRLQLQRRNHYIFLSLKSLNVTFILTREEGGGSLSNNTKATSEEQKVVRIYWEVAFNCFYLIFCNMS